MPPENGRLQRLQADLGRWTTGLQVTAVARSGRAMRHGLAGCFTPGTGLWAGRLHSDWSSDRHRVPRPSQIDPLLDPVVPPHPLRAQPWAYNTEIYKRRNEIERLFRRLKGFRRIFSRFDKLDVMFAAFIHFALIVESLR